MASTTQPASYEAQLESNWRTLALAGIVVGLLGILAISFPFATGLSITYGIGLLLILSGIVHGGHALTVRGWRGQLWQLVVGVVSVVAGLVIVANPVLGLASLTLLAAAYLLADGVAELWLSSRLESRSGRWSVALSGFLSAVLAGLLLAGFPADSAWAIGVLVGVSLLLTGLSMVVVSSDGRRASRAFSPETRDEAV
ncbi:HdeD family acid-resistance protein [Halovivax gelatinilyticus]|uniref:HdeD family acid-resistance protein n=1 Tax=Halovivax gelatinilyticus TaxID=2961597 RepID=UPI0020CA8105|nr:DUF308 domain-containing protein [Halovivax gelatinilyticus]